MSQGSSPPALEWPRWQWRFSKFVDLADVASIALGFMLFLCPSLVGERRFVIGIPLMSVPVSIPALVWVCRIGYITWLRARHYPRLYRSARRDSEALAQANRQIYALVERDINGRAFEIAGASWVRSRLCIALKKREDYKLAEGDMLVVIHLDDAMPMGWFEVIDVRSNEYYAHGVRSVDAVWSGYVRKQGEVSILPYMTAIHIPQEKGQ